MTRADIADVNVHGPLLARFKADLVGLYGADVARIVLFGSRARGDGHEDSDYDIAVFLDPLPDRWAEIDRLADLRSSYLYETGVFFDVKPFATSRYHDESPLMHEIRRDGIEL